MSAAFDVCCWECPILFEALTLGFAHACGAARGLGIRASFDRRCPVPVTTLDALALGLACVRAKQPLGPA